MWVYPIDMSAPLVDCDDCGGCGTDTNFASRTRSRIRHTFAESGRYVLVIEGWSTDEGTYVVVMECPASRAPTASPTHVEPSLAPVTARPAPATH